MMEKKCGMNGWFRYVKKVQNKLCIKVRYIIIKALDMAFCFDFSLAKKKGKKEGKKNFFNRRFTLIL